MTDETGKFPTIVITELVQMAHALTYDPLCLATFKPETLRAIRRDIAEHFQHLADTDEERFSNALDSSEAQCDFILEFINKN